MGAAGALAAWGLKQEVDGALRVALAELAPGLAMAAQGEKMGVRRAVLKAVRQRGQRGLAVRLRATFLSGGQRRNSR